MGIVYFSDRKYLKRICDFIYNSYLDTKELDSHDQAFIDFSKINRTGGVNDITLFERYEFKNPGCAYNIEFSSIEVMSFINSFESSLYRRDLNGNVRLVWRNKIPNATLLSGATISIVGIHCFGKQKKIFENSIGGENGGVVY